MTISDRRGAGALDAVRDYVVTYLAEAPLQRLCPRGTQGEHSFSEVVKELN
jgi:hypothetical protein